MIRAFEGDSAAFGACKAVWRQSEVNMWGCNQSSFPVAGRNLADEKYLDKLLDAYAHSPEGLTLEKCGSLELQGGACAELVKSMPTGAAGEVTTGPRTALGEATTGEGYALKNAGVPQGVIDKLISDGGKWALKERVKWLGSTVNKDFWWWDYNANIRGNMASELGEIGDSSAIPSLAIAISDKDPQVAQKALLALGKMQDESAQPLLDQAFKNQSPSVQVAMAGVFGMNGTFSAVPTLLEAFVGDNTELSVAAGKALTQITDYEYRISSDAENGNRFTMILISMVKTHNDSKVRGEAVNRLGKLPGNGVIAAALFDALRDRDPSVSRAATKALGEIAGENVANVFVNAMQNESAVIRQTAVRGLNRFKGDPQVIWALKDALSDKDPVVRAAAEEALRGVGSVEAFPVIMAMLRDDNPNMHVTANVIFQNINPADVVPILVDMIKKARQADIAEKLFLSINNDQAVPALVNLFVDENEKVQNLAAKVLRKIGGEKVVSAMLSVLDHSWNFPKKVKTNDHNGLKAIKAILRSRWHMSNDVGVMAVRLLCDLKAKEAIPVLIRILTTLKPCTETDHMGEQTRCHSFDQVGSALLAFKEDAKVRKALITTGYCQRGDSRLE